MICPTCKNEVHNIYLTFIKGVRTEWCKRCFVAEPIQTRVIDTVNFRDYPKNNGNVSKLRVEMIQRRKLCPDGNGEVILRSHTGKITDRKAGNY